MLRATITMLRAGPALAFFCTALTACGASDTAPEPEPELNTVGAFLAGDDGTGTLTLLRTLETLLVPNDRMLFITIYDVKPSSLEDAREISKRHDIPISVELTNASETQLRNSSYRAVWYRTLTEEEARRVQ
jgi:hypothetical protein